MEFMLADLGESKRTVTVHDDERQGGSTSPAHLTHSQAIAPSAIRGRARERRATHTWIPDGIRATSTPRTTCSS